jgi:DNA-binding response OmpR family regulator
VAARILVVDDELMVTRLIERALRDEGYEVTAVSDGERGLEAAIRANPAFDLVVTNTWMSGLSGGELIVRLRQHFPSIPILHIDDVARHKTPRESHPDIPTLYKPFCIAALRDAVRVLLAG